MKLKPTYELALKNTLKECQKCGNKDAKTYLDFALCYNCWMNVVEKIEKSIENNSLYKKEQ